MVVKKYILNVDLMRRYSAKTPEFRRGDSGTLIFRVFNNGVEFDISRATKAEVYHETSMGTQIPSECTFTTLNGKRVIQYDYEKIIMVELGFTKTMLVIYEGDTAVSIIPFNVWIYSDMKGGANSYLELIQDLANQIEDLIMDLNNTIPQSEKGKPNGVASLDGSGKIPLSQMPKEVDSYIKHMTETVAEHHVHGMKPDEDGLWMYKTANGDWQYFGFSDTAAGGGAPQVQLLEATIVVSNGLANITYTGTPTLAASKWATGTRDKSYFATNGTTFTGSSFVVSQLGMYTLFYRDSNGIEYVKAFAVTSSMIPSADISVDVEDGYVTVDIVGNTAIQKWAKDEQSIPYFANYGNVFAGNTFEVTETGRYTIYYKLSSGLEYVYLFDVFQSDLPQLPIGTPISYKNNGDIIKFSGKEWIILDSQNGRLLAKQSVNTMKFDTNSSKTFSTISTSNVGYYLNNTFLDSFSSTEKNLIVSKQWGIGGLDNSDVGDSSVTVAQNKAKEQSTKVTAKVGLMSYSELRTSVAIITANGAGSSLMTWLITPHKTDNLVWALLSGTFAISPTQDRKVNPSIYLKTDTMIDGNGNVIV